MSQLPVLAVESAQTSMRVIACINSQNREYREYRENRAQCVDATIKSREYAAESNARIAV
jgi:hypothetical protein